MIELVLSKSKLTVSGNKLGGEFLNKTLKVPKGTVGEGEGKSLIHFICYCGPILVFHYHQALEDKPVGLESSRRVCLEAISTLPTGDSSSEINLDSGSKPQK